MINFETWLDQNKDLLYYIRQHKCGYIINYSTGVAVIYPHEIAIGETLMSLAYNMPNHSDPVMFTAIVTENIHDIVETIKSKKSTLSDIIIQAVNDASTAVQHQSESYGADIVDGERIEVTLNGNVHINLQYSDHYGVNYGISFDVPMSPGRGHSIIWNKEERMIEDYRRARNILINLPRADNKINANIFPGKITTCEHIYGLHSELNRPIGRDDLDLLESDDGAIKFAFCPKCGTRL